MHLSEINKSTIGFLFGMLVIAAVVVGAKFLGQMIAGNEGAVILVMIAAPLSVLLALKTAPWVSRSLP